MNKPSIKTMFENQLAYEGCPECKYARAERAAIHQFDGGATKEEAERLAEDERCRVHQ